MSSGAVLRCVAERATFRIPATAWRVCGLVLLLAPALAWSQAPSPAAVRRAAHGVFSQAAYDRSIRTSLWNLFWEFVWEKLTQLFTAISHSPATRPIVYAVVVFVAVLVVARIVVAMVNGGLVVGRNRALGGGARRLDPWTDAQRLAALGRYTEAAHALYAALLDGVARREQLRLHPSKTVGDYLRELRRRSSALVPSFRDFARLYEVVVYGLGVCDRDRYERLYALASGMLAPGP